MYVSIVISIYVYLSTICLCTIYLISIYLYGRTKGRRYLSLCLSSYLFNHISIWHRLSIWLYSFFIYFSFSFLHFFLFSLPLSSVLEKHTCYFLLIKWFINFSPCFSVIHLLLRFALFLFFVFQRVQKYASMFVCSSSHCVTHFSIFLYFLALLKQRDFFPVFLMAPTSFLGLLFTCLLLSYTRLGFFFLFFIPFLFLLLLLALVQ